MANKPFVVVVRFPAKIALCAQVTVTPEDNKITVFHKGKPHGSNAEIPCGGQIHPIPIDGDSVQWKNAQKKLKKNITSEAINNAMPNLIPSCTLNVWLPSNVDSVTISENQRNK